MHTKKYKECPKKLDARLKTIIEPYRELFGLKLSKGKEFWSLCSQQVDIDGQILNGCELDQLLSSGLINESQYHGVDRESYVIEINKKFLPKCHWYNDTFMNALLTPDKINPGIVNIDTIEQPKTGLILVAKVLDLLNRRNINNVLVVTNFIKNDRYHERSDDIIIKEIANNVDFRRCISLGNWQYHSAIKYNGTGKKSKTTMGTIVIYKH